MGRPAVRLTVDAEDKPAIATIENVIISPDGTRASLDPRPRHDPMSPIDHEAAEDAELVMPDRPAEAEGPGPEGETSSVDLRRVLDAVTRAQGTVAETKRELGQANAALQASGQRLRQAEERQARDRREALARQEAEACERLNAVNAVNSWY
jgi:hypothetical protein